MKIIQLNHYDDIVGGASRAAFRIYEAMRRCEGVETRMWVNVKMTQDKAIWAPEGSIKKIAPHIKHYRHVFGQAVMKFMRIENEGLHSPSVLPSNWPKRLNQSDADLVHMHWINHEMLSVSDIGRIRKPLVWTLHDMWAFCGAEHYTDGFCWRAGYQRGNRPDYEAGFDLNRWTWRRKHKHWRRPFQIVTPSTWLADCVRESALMRDWPVAVIPNPIDTDVWRPVDKREARALLDLPPDDPVLVFGAVGGGREPRKGFDLLQQALQHLRGKAIGLRLLVFGEEEPDPPPDLGFPVHYAGYLHETVSQRIFYSAADVMIVPSRLDNLPNTAVEAHSCGTPVVAFDVGGLRDIVDHRQTGYLARAFDTKDLAQGILWVLEQKEIQEEASGLPYLEGGARKRAVELFSYPVVAEQHKRLYEQMEAS